ncbi:MAG: arsenate reductase ArsC [Xanthobacteraceae bacterium]|nr:arsenate reductase ArsC [Xanthobacteraceae bacterium]
MEKPARAPQAVLFMCGQNTVRSPMAAALLRQMMPGGLYVQSAGVRPGEPNPFAISVMDELGLDISQHKPWTVDELEDWEGFNFDLIITLAPEAHHRALEMTATLATDVEYWPTPDPVGTEGRRELQLDAYRATRDDLKAKIRARFAPPKAGNE